MTEYTVTSKPSVKTRLADIWLTALDRNAVTNAANSIDSQFQSNPAELGESRSGSVRILIELPLAVVYDVREDDRLVEVLAIRSFIDRSD